MPIISPIALSAASKGRGGISMSAGEIAIRAGNTVAWYDFTDATTLTYDGSNLVSKWADKLGSGRDLTAATTARPTLSADGITFNGTGNYMKTAGFTYNQPEFIYLVVKQLSWTQPDYLLDGLNSDTMVLYQQGLTPQLRLSAGSLSDNNGNLAVNAWGIIRILFNGASSKFQINETTALTGNYGASNAGGITVGKPGAVANYYSNIIVKEAIFRNSADDSITETAIYNYLKSKYSL